MSGRAEYPGFTRRSALALFFASSILLPLSLLTNLLTGVSLLMAAPFITAIIFDEFFRMMGRRLTSQEIFIIYSLSGVASSSLPALDFIFRAFFMKGWVASAFVDPRTGMSLPELVSIHCSWWAPPLGSSAYLARTLWHPDWAVPVLISTLNYGVLWILQEMAVTLILAKLYEVERLPFPLASMEAELCVTLAERERGRMRVYVLGVVLGMVYAVFLYGFYFVGYAVTGVPAALIPVPWLDLTTGMLGIEKVLPGAAMGLATDPFFYLLGFLVPTHVAVLMAVGSLSTWVIGNWAARTYLAHLFPEWVREWVPGSTLIYVFQRSYIRVWIGPQVGFILAAAVFYLLRGWRSLATLVRVLRESPNLYGFSVRNLLLIYLAAVGCSILLVHALVPTFPVWVVVAVAVGWGLVHALVATRAMGETGYTFVMPYAWHLSVLLFGRGDVRPWFIAPTISGGISVPGTLINPAGVAYFMGAPVWANEVRVATRLRARVVDFFKGFMFIFVLYTVFSFVYASFLWGVAPMPSSIYPFTLVSWPLSATIHALWVSGQLAYKLDIIAYSFLLMLGVGGLGQLLSSLTGLPFSLIALVAGTSLIPAYSIPILVGNLVGRVLGRVFGAEVWERSKYVLAAGILSGEAIVIGLSAAALMLAKSTWILPF